MRIAHVIVSLDPRFGGPPMVAARLAAAQARAGHEVSILSEPLAPDAQARLKKSCARVPAWDHVHRLDMPPTPGPGFLSYALGRMSAATRPLVAQFDLLHLHGIWELLLPAVASAARQANRPYLIAPHGMLDPWSLQQKALKKRLALNLIHRRMLQGAAALHVLNENERDLLAPLRLGTPAEVIPNGIFLEEIDPLPASELFRSRWPILGDRPYALFLGRLHYKKGLDHLADAFAQLAARRPEAMLVVVGPDDGARADFESRIRAADLSRRVVMTGPIYGDDRLAAVAGAHLFCLPSRQEGFSVAVVEALACGVPCIVSQQTHFHEVATRGCGYVVALEPTSIADPMELLFADPALRNRMGESGRRYARDELTWDAVAAKTIRLYERLVSR